MMVIIETINLYVDKNIHKPNKIYFFNVDAMDTGEWANVVGASEEKIKALEKKYQTKIENLQVFALMSVNITNVDRKEGGGSY